MPIKKLANFMQKYPKHMKNRMEVRHHNEIGMLAQTMNDMLDDIDTMNREIMTFQKKQFELEIAKKQSEMIAYRSQINPHFLYNTFECIRGMALYHDVKDVAEISQSLSKLFRYSVRGSEYATVGEELDSVREYAKIIKYRFMDKYKVTIKSSEDVLKYKIPKMTIQPFVENAVQHGLEPMRRGGQVCVHVYISVNRMINIEIIDDGSGISKKQLCKLKESMREYEKNGVLPREIEGIGILNTYRRIRLFYGDSAKLTIRSKPRQGTIVSILIPV